MVYSDTDTVYAVNNAATQGLAMAVGAQSKFSWSSVAAAGVGAVVGDYVSTKFGPGLTNALAGNPASSNYKLNLANATLATQSIVDMSNLMTNAATRSLIDGTDFGDNVMAALPDVIGQTIGNAVAGRIAVNGGASGTTGDGENLFDEIGQGIGSLVHGVEHTASAVGDFLGFDGQFGYQGPAGRSESLGGLGDAIGNLIASPAPAATTAATEPVFNEQAFALPPTSFLTPTSDRAFAQSLVFNGNTDGLWNDIRTTSHGYNWVLDPDLGQYHGTVEVPRPSLAPQDLNDGTPDFHRYAFSNRIEGGEDVPSYVLDEILRENAVPNGWQKPATQEGAHNDAADLFGIPVPASQVNSYERTTQSGQYWVVNVTRSVLDGYGADGGLHSLSSGWVASTMYRNQDGTVDLLTYGEGNAYVQSHNNPTHQVFDNMNATVWNERATHVQAAVNRAIQSYNTRGVWSWR
ncbi:MAG: hypothetical protein QM759_04795 [Terricaulis sp.]